jgi:hypothetical protein
MCYLQREQDAYPEPGPARVPPRNAASRPRWAAAAGMALVASLAAAALVASPPAQAPEPVKQATGLVPIATQARTPAGTVERMALPADDDVPQSTAASNGRVGHCHESL